MLKKRLSVRLLATLVWLVLVTLLRWQWRWELIGFWIGGVIGTYLLDLDHFFYCFLIHPEQPTSQKLKALWQQRQYKEISALLVQTRAERLRLPFHNAAFQTGFYVFCFWVLISTPGLLGSGLVMAMALDLLRKEAWSLLKGKEVALRQWLFWPLNREISFYQQRLFVALMAMVFLALSLLLI